MGKKAVATLAVVALLGVFALPLWAQGPRQGPGYGPGPYCFGGFDNAKKTTINAQVEEVSPPFLVVKDAKETLTIFAGPIPLWAKEGFAATKGDRVKVEAAEFAAPWGKRLVAYNITNLTTKKELKLRDKDGYPIWKRGKGFARRGYKGKRWGRHMGYGPGYGMGYGPGNCPNR